MNILYLSASPIPSRKANSIHVMNMCQAFAKNGHDVFLFAPDKKGDIQPVPQDVFAFYGVDSCFSIAKLPWLPIRGRGVIYALVAATKARTLRPDLVYGRDFASCFFSTKFGLPVVFELHMPPRDSGTVCEWLFRGLIKSPHLQHIVVITHALKEHCEREYPSTNGRICVAPDGANPVREGIAPLDLPNRGQRLQVGYVGHLYQGRGVDLVLSLAQACSWADFHLVGGTPTDLEYWRRASSRSHNVHFYGFLPPPIAEQLRIACDVLLAPYQHEVRVAGNGEANTVNWMSPLKVFEYMAAGKAILCSDLPVLREVLRHDHNASLCPADDLESWQHALERLRDDISLRDRLGQRARNGFLTNYTWCARAAAVLNHLAC